MPDSPSDQPPQIPPQQFSSSPLHQTARYVGPAPNSDSKVIKAVVITVAIFVAFGVLALGALGIGIWYVAKSVHTTPSAAFTETDLGVAIYPGAEPSLRGSRMQIVGKTMLNATYFTSDPMEQVIAFYLQTAGPTARRTMTSRGAVIRLSRSAGNFTSVRITRMPDEAGGKTYITITCVSDTAASHSSNR